MFDGFTRREEQERIRRIAIDLEVREQELRKLRKNGDHASINSLEGEICLLRQSLNLFSDLAVRQKKQSFFI